MNVTQTTVRKTLVSLKESENASNLIQRLRFNDYPSAAEHCTFHLMIADYNERLLSSCRSSLTCDPNDIGVLQHTGSLIDSSEVLAETAFLETRINHIKSLLSPIRRIPREILTVIFSLCLPKEWFDVDGLPNPGFMNTCYSWRTVCLQFVPFWNRILIKTPVQSIVKLKRFITRMERSGSAPLNIRVECINGSIPILDSLFSHAHHLKEVHLANPSLLSLEKSCKMKPIFPILEVLSLGDSRRQEWLGLYKWRFDMFIDSPQLHHVSLTNPLTSSRIGLPWAQLRYIAVHHFTEKECVQVIRLCPTVVKCDLQNIRASFQLPNAEELLTAPRQYMLLANLANLMITTGNQEPDRCLKEIFDAITLPALRALTISCPPEWFPRGLAWPQHTILDFLKRSKCFINDLNIECANITDEFRSQIEHMNTWHQGQPGSFPR